MFYLVQGFEPKVREKHPDEKVAEMKGRKCKVQPSLFQKVVKAKHQQELRTQYVDTLSTNSGRQPQNSITPVVTRPAAAPLQYESPLQAHSSTSEPPPPRPTSRTQWYVPLPSDDELPIDEDNYWAPFREDYEAASQMTQWDTDQRAIEISQMDEGASGSLTPTRLRSPSTSSRASAVS